MEILLWEQDIDRAWAIVFSADIEPCDEDPLLLKVARARSATHPAEAIPFFLGRARLP